MFIEGVKRQGNLQKGGPGQGDNHQGRPLAKKKTSCPIKLKEKSTRKISGGKWFLARLDHNPSTQNIGKCAFRSPPQFQPQTVHWLALRPNGRLGKKPAPYKPPHEPLDAWQWGSGEGKRAASFSTLAVPGRRFWRRGPAEAVLGGGRDRGPRRSAQAPLPGTPLRGSHAAARR